MMADDALVEPAPGAPPLSMHNTWRPVRDNSNAIDAPITPAPMMITSTDFCDGKELTIESQEWLVATMLYRQHC